MTIFTDGPRLQREGFGIDELGAGVGDVIGTTARSSLVEGPTAQLYGVAELQEAKGERDSLAEPIGRLMAGEDLADVVGRPQPIPEMPVDAARQRVKEAGLDKVLHLPSEGAIKVPALDIMINRAREKREREATIARGPGGFVPGALSVGTSFLVGAVDPLNVASAFIPVIGEARYAKLMAEAGESALARGVLRAEVGAAGGAVGLAALQPLEAYARTQEGQDFTFAEALRNVLFGAVLGATLHGGGGALADVLRARKGEALYPFGPKDPLRPQPLPGELRAPPPESLRVGRYLGEEPSPALSAIADLPPRAHEDAMRAASAALVHGEPVRSAEMLRAAAQDDPRLAVSLSAARTDFPPLGEGARIEGHGDHGPVVVGLEDRLGEAVNWLRQAQVGDVRGVLTHPDVPDRIDIIWGDRDHGVAHIDAKHPGALDRLPELWPGLRASRVDDNHFVLDSPQARAVIARDYGGEPKTWLLTFFEVKERGARPDQETIRGPGDSGPAAQSPGPPRSESIGRSVREVEATWRDLSTRHEDLDMVNASREAEALAEPGSTQVTPDGAKPPQPAREQGAEGGEGAPAEPSRPAFGEPVSPSYKAARESEQRIAGLYDEAVADGRISERDRAQMEDVLQKIDQEAEAQAQLVRSGAACLAAGFGLLA